MGRLRDDEVVAVARERERSTRVVLDHSQPRVRQWIERAFFLARGTGARPIPITVAAPCGRHDTLGGHCAAESNTVRYALQKKFMHSCRDNYLIALQHADIGLTKRDLVPNINFFMNVPVAGGGDLKTRARSIVGYR